MTVLRRGSFWLMLGAGLGGLSALSPGAGFFMALSLAAGWALRRLAGPLDRGFITALFAAGLLCRLTLSLGMDFQAWVREGRAPFSLHPPETHSPQYVFDRTRRPFRIPDSDDYSERGYALAQYAHGSEGPLLSHYLNNPYGRTAYLYVIGGFYYLFGFSPITVKWMNGLLGALLGPVAFFLALGCFNRWVARGAGWLVALFPSLTFWSTSNLKEPGLLLATVLLLIFLLKLQQACGPGKRCRFGILAVGAILIHSSLRVPQYALILLGGWGASLLILRLLRRGWRLRLVLLAGAALILAGPILRWGMTQALWAHTSYVYAEGGSYRFLPHRYYTNESRTDLQRGRLDVRGSVLAQWIGKAVFHYLLEPFPWRTRNLWDLLAYPQMILWYFCLPLAAAGAVWGLRGNASCVLPLLLATAAWILMGAVSSGNIGTVLRFRDMVSPMVLLFACAGAWRILKGPMKGAFSSRAVSAPLAGIGHPVPHKKGAFSSRAETPS